jgi:hypothetical protein
VDCDLRPLDRGLDRILDPVADVVRFIDRHGARHDEVELDERRRPRGARAHVVRLQRAAGVGLDRLADARLDLG